MTKYTLRYKESGRFVQEGGIVSVRYPPEAFWVIF